MVKKFFLSFLLLLIVGLTGCSVKEGEKEQESVIIKKSRVNNSVYFRGTSNNWGKTEMFSYEEGLYKIVVNFDGKGNKDRFKIDVSGNWSEAYPGKDYIITEGVGSYLILFNDLTKEISVEKLPKLKTKEINLTVLKNDSNFKLPDAGEYINEDGTVESVNLVWSPELDITNEGTKIYSSEYKGSLATVTVKVKDPLKKESNYPEGVYFRGTENNWGKTKMVLCDDYIWKTFIDFKENGNADRFKIDVSGNWREAYPAKDYIIREGAGEYTVTFNELTKEVKAVKGAVKKIKLDMYSITIDKEDIEFKLPKYGEITNENGVVERVTIKNWSPVLDKTKQGTTVYYAAADNGAIAKFDLTVKNYTDYPNGVYFRGTSNSWEKTKMESAGYYIRQIVQEFKGNTDDRFKIDVSGNWTTSYPQRDFMIGEGAGKYLITFNEKTKDITVLKLNKNEMIEVERGTAKINMYGFNFNIKSASDFYISKYEVTQGEFMDIMGFNPSYSIGNSGNNPVENVTYYDAVIYCNKLSEKEGITPYYNISEIVYDTENNKNRVLSAKISKNTISEGYRIPILKEWRYAAAGGVKSEGKLYAGSDEIVNSAWYNKNAKEELLNLYNPQNEYYAKGATHSVGQKNSNELGIYDMSGNAAEITDGENTLEMIVCGGSWMKSDDECLITTSEVISFYGDSNQKNYRKDIGFRIAKNK